MEQFCKFCSDCDLQEHVPSLDIDIAKAIESGTIPPVSTLDEFNNMDIDTVENATRLREDFDALDYNFKLKSFSNSFSSGTGNNVTPFESSTPISEGSGN